MGDPDVVGGPGRGPAGARAWRLLRRLLPEAWRARHGEEVLEVHVALAGGEERARGVRFWLGVARDVVLTALAVHVDAWRGAEERGPGRGRARRWEAIVLSLRLALRGLRRTPVFAVSVVAILGVGMAANVTMFRVLDHLLLSPPGGIEDAESVRRIYVHARWELTGTVDHRAALAHPDYRQLRGVDAFDDVAGYSGWPLTLVVAGQGERVNAGLATASYFRLLRVQPVLGRFYGEAEDRLGAEGRVVVLSHAFWQRRFGGDANVVGRELEIGKGYYTVIGVAPRGFSGVDLTPVDVWLPLYAATEAEYGTQWVDAQGWFVMAGIARVAPDRLDAAAEAATVAYRAGREGEPGFDREARIALMPLIAARGPHASPESQVARLLGVLALLVLLITCANVGNLFLARVLARRREIAVQAALGVSGRRVFGQFVLEVAVLATVAAVLALWLSGTASQALFRVLLPDAMPPRGFDLRVALATVAVAFTTAALTAALPALRAARTDLMEALRRGDATPSALRVRRALLMAQAALAVVLLVGAGLFIRSLHRAETLDLGLDRSAFAVEIELEGGVNGEVALMETLNQAMPRIREHPSVESVAAATLAPFGGFWGASIRLPEGDTIVVGAEGPRFYAVTGDYFATLGMRIVNGRPLTEADDRPDAPRVAVVGERLARRAWPERGALGRCFMPDRDDEACTTVVGVVRDVVQSVRADAPPLTFYIPTHHPSAGGRASTLLVRAREDADPAALRSHVRDAVPGARFVAVEQLEDRIAPQFRSWRLGASLLTAFGLLALVVAAAGLYSTLAFDMTQRRRELGIRAALGAPARRLVRSTVAGNLATVGGGIGIGLLVAAALGRTAEAMLFRVRAADPLVFGVVVLTLLAVTTLAAAGPAWAATRVDPAEPLRDDHPSTP